MRRAAAGSAVISELPPAPLGRGDLYPTPRHAAGACRGARYHRRDHRPAPGAGDAKPGGRLSRPDRSGRGRRDVIRMFGYLAWRSAHNRVARQMRHLRSPRYVAALLLGLAYLWFMVIAQRPAPVTGGLADPRWLELVGALALLGVVAWGWIFGVERRVLAFSPAEVTFLFSGPVSRRGLIQFKLLRSQLLILFNALLVDPDPVARAPRAFTMATGHFDLGAPHYAVVAPAGGVLRSDQPGRAWTAGSAASSRLARGVRGGADRFDLEHCRRPAAPGGCRRPDTTRVPVGPGRSGGTANSDRTDLPVPA